MLPYCFCCGHLHLQGTRAVECLSLRFRACPLHLEPHSAQTRRELASPTRVRAGGSHWFRRHHGSGARTGRTQALPDGPRFRRRQQQAMNRVRNDVCGGFVLVQSIAQLRLDLLRLLRVVSTPLPQLVDGDIAVLEELVGRLSGGTVPGRRRLWGVSPMVA